MRKTVLSITLGTMAIGMTLPTAALSNEYPNQPITIVVPFAPGGAADATGRILAEALSAELGVNVIVENVGGAGGAIGTTRILTSEPNGYTIGLGHMGTLAAAVPLNPALQYDPATDFDYLGLVSTSPNVLYVRADFPADTLEEFVSLSQTVVPSLGHGGIGAASHVACEMFLQQTAIEADLIAYRGFGQTIADVMGGQIDGGCDLLASVAGHAQQGSIRVLAIAADDRSPLLPDAPTSIEAGFPDFLTSTWTGLFVVTGTPDEVNSALQDALRVVMHSDIVHKRLADIGAEVPTDGNMGGEHMHALVISEIENWSQYLSALPQ